MNSCHNCTFYKRKDCPWEGTYHHKDENGNEIGICNAWKGNFDMTKIQNVWNDILDMLPREPRSYDTSEDTGFWTNGDEILCSSELEMEIVRSFLDDVFKEYENYNLITGWYDPFEDVNNGETDDCTGFNYIRLE